MKFNDTKIYLYFSIAMLVAGILFGLPGIYSRFVTEPSIESFLRENAAGDELKQAYLMLRNPHIFAGYDRFDEGGAGIEYILKEFDNRIDQKQDLTANDRVYLEVLLQRRVQGSDLSIKTMMFFILLSMLGGIGYVIEKNYDNKP